MEILLMGGKAVDESRQALGRHEVGIALVGRKVETVQA
jgi:hypothetical protein